LADLAQLESAILNLAVNARDAMPDGGTLNITASNLCIEAVHTGEYDDITPGEYVVIAVRDNGTGIAPEVIERVFDPFFTTKGSEGTGLGLSQVFGFAKQSGGYLKIESVLGLGTVVRLYLPRASNDIESSPAVALPVEYLGKYRNSVVARSTRDTREGATR
jgi:signal transduction histidine kinase